MKWLSEEDTDEMTNSQRAQRAHEAAVEYSSPDQRVESVQDFPEEPLPRDSDADESQMAEILSDLLCDLQHLANWYGINWTTVSDRGQRCNEEEGDEEAYAVEAMADGAPLDEGNETWETDGSELIHQATIASDRARRDSAVTTTIDNEDGKA